jgi:hypothetical protein
VVLGGSGICMVGVPMRRPIPRYVAKGRLSALIVATGREILFASTDIRNRWLVSQCGCAVTLSGRKVAPEATPATSPKLRQRGHREQSSPRVT